MTQEKSATAPPIVIVTPVLNGAGLIGETLAAISGQSDRNWVHYIIDGGSTDGTPDIVRASMADEPRRRLIEGQDRGLYDAVFKGFDSAQADGFADPAGICLYLNADDLLMPWALATLRAAFARTGAEWITSLPCFWDVHGRMTLLLPYAWHPRWLISLGLFQPNALGCIQQESSFFKRSLLDRVPAAAIAAIRSSRLAGDFHLWRAFARFTAPLPLPLPLSGFRRHAANASRHADIYRDEIAAAGAWIVPPMLGRIMRLAFRPFALFQLAFSFQGQARRTDKGGGP